MEDPILYARAVECLDTLDQIQHFRYWFAHPSEVVGELRKREAETRKRELAKLPKRILKRELELERKREPPKPKDEAWVKQQAVAGLGGPYGVYGLLRSQFGRLIDAAGQREIGITPLKRVLEIVLSSNCTPIDDAVPESLLGEAVAALKSLATPGGETLIGPFSVAQLATQFDVDRKTIQRWIRSRSLPSKKLSRSNYMIPAMWQPTK